MKLKEARKRDINRLKANALKAKNKALSEERRVHKACVKELKRDVNNLDVITSTQKIHRGRKEK